MKTPVIILFIFSLFYFASSCKKGDTNNTVPPYDSTHYNDSVKHVADSVAHLEDSVYNSPYGIYYGTTGTYYTVAGCNFISSFSDTFYVLKLPRDSIFIGKGSNGNTFFHNSQEYYSTSSGINLYEAIIGSGHLKVHEHDDYGSGEYEEDDFSGSK